MDREKEREIELESAMYTNCLLLGLDPAIIGLGGSNATPRVGFFRHSNPKLGEQLLYFILSSLRGPIQSAKVQSRFPSLYAPPIFTLMIHIHIFQIQFLCIFVFVLLSSTLHHVPNVLRSFRISIKSGQFSIPLNRGIFER